MESSPSIPTREWRFWALFPGLCLSSFLCALDSTIISTALPTIISQLRSTSLYVWAINGYTITFTAVQPFYGQAADIFGRKVCLVASLVLFGIGSVVCAVAHDTATFIAGRAVQGLGGGGLSILPAMIVCDLVPQRQRQTWTGIIYAAFALGTFVGPVLGGSLTQSPGWPWIFWINLPLTALAVFLVAAFLRVHHVREESLWTGLAQVDYVGNAILMASIVAVLYPLSVGGGQAPWNSWKVLFPLLFGLLVGLSIYLWYESSSWCRRPTTPIRLFKKSASLIGFALTFVHGVVLYWTSYFLPVYFQAILLATPQESGIKMLPGILPMVPSGIVGGIVLAKTGRYKPNQIVGYALTAIAFGCFCLLDQSTPTAVWVILELILAAGAGFVLTAVLPAIQASLPESDVGSSTATWGVVQSLGFVCGVAIPSSIFNSQVDDMLWMIGDDAVRRALGGGQAYAHSTRAYLLSLKADTQQQLVAVFVAALRLTWQVGLGLALLGFVLGVIIPEVALRQDLETEYGFREREKEAPAVAMVSSPSMRAHGAQQTSVAGPRVDEI